MIDVRRLSKAYGSKRVLDEVSFTAAKSQITCLIGLNGTGKGNAAKVNLLLGLSLDADYVLMDEPFSGIDLFGREQIAGIFTSHLIEDRCVLMTTHEIQDIEHLIDKAVLLGQGRVLKEFSAEDVRHREGKSVVDVMREVYQP
ncbi:MULTISPECIES: ATP-binding cassette domain-containing protein [Paenibacillus]|uniref:hypothetical protein n=1 Tax=Paenibacillus TaxID=44249 RepID=UPI0022B8CC1C|nr:hypothetical protein [Paenibacillus caseinilyticus]MCZ8520432.1 hypothetical protein [Paenibacillus caseinilyticus]